jgi:predicted nucleic acid-binding protein
MPAVVSDTSVLHYLTVTRQFNCLPKLFGQIIIPSAVWDEVSRRKELPVHSQVANAIEAGWLKIESAHDRQAVQSLQGFLGAGESEAIILAKEFQPSLLLMDDLDGRTTAFKLKLSVTGTVGVLVRARNLELIPQLKPLLDELIEMHRFRFGKTLYAAALHDVGESA